MKKRNIPPRLAFDTILEEHGMPDTKSPPVNWNDSKNTRQPNASFEKFAF
jgi:hypothetical protein